MKAPGGAFATASAAALMATSREYKFPNVDASREAKTGFVVSKPLPPMRLFVEAIRAAMMLSNTSASCLLVDLEPREQKTTSITTIMPVATTAPTIMPARIPGSNAVEAVGALGLMARGLADAITASLTAMEKAIEAGSTPESAPRFKTAVLTSVEAMLRAGATAWTPRSAR